MRALMAKVQALLLVAAASGLAWGCLGADSATLRLRDDAAEIGLALGGIEQKWRLLRHDIDAPADSAAKDFAFRQSPAFDSLFLGDHIHFLPNGRFEEKLLKLTINGTWRRSDADPKLLLLDIESPSLFDDPDLPHEMTVRVRELVNDKLILEVRSPRGDCVNFYERW